MRITTIAAALAAIAMPVQAMSTADRTMMWKNADANGDNQLFDNEAQFYVKLMKDAKLTMTDTRGKTVWSDEFMKACESGAFDRMSM